MESVSSRGIGISVCAREGDERLFFPLLQLFMIILHP